MRSNRTLILLFAAALAAPAAAQEPAPQSEPDRAVPRARSGESRNPNRPDALIRHQPRAAAPAERTTSPRAVAPPDSSSRPMNVSASAEQQGGRRRPPSGGGGGGGNSGGGAVRREPGPRSQSDGNRGGGDHPVFVDRAVPRGSVPHQSRPVYVYRATPWPWYYDPWLYGGGFGIGYAYYSPWSWYGPGWGAYAPAYGPGWGYGYTTGRVRLKVTPRDAEVFVDNYYAGTVDDFDGNFQGLRLEPGNHKVEVRKPGFESLTYDVHVQPDRTITFRGEMKTTP